MSNDEVSQAIDRVSMAGSWFLGIGWFIFGVFSLLAISTPFFILSEEESSAFILMAPLFYLLGLGIALLYIKSGKYIKYMRGPLIPVILAGCVLSSIFWLGGLIGLVLAIIAWVNYKRLGETDISINYSDEELYNSTITRTDKLVFLAAGGMVLFTSLVAVLAQVIQS